MVTLYCLPRTHGWETVTPRNNVGHGSQTWWKQTSINNLHPFLLVICDDITYLPPLVFCNPCSYLPFCQGWMQCKQKQTIQLATFTESLCGWIQLWNTYRIINLLLLFSFLRKCWGQLSSTQTKETSNHKKIQSICCLTVWYDFNKAQLMDLSWSSKCYAYHLYKI